MVGLGDSFGRVTDNDKLKGVRGFLLLPPAIMLISTAGLTVQTIVLLFSDGSNHEDELIGIMILAAVLVPLGVLSIVRLMQEKKSARGLMMAFFGILAVLNVLGVFLEPGPGLFVLLIQLRGAYVTFAIVIYFIVSKRVRLTLVN